MLIHRFLLYNWVVELGVVIGKNGRNIPADRAMDFVAGFCLALDLTARDLQVRFNLFF